MPVPVEDTAPNVEEGLRDMPTPLVPRVPYYLFKVTYFPSFPPERERESTAKPRNVTACLRCVGENITCFRFQIC